METITGLLGICVGLLLARLAGDPRPRRQEEEEPAGYRRLRAQMDNFMAYDGTARGQKSIED